MKDSLKYLPLALLLFISIIACVVAQTDGVIDNQTDSNQKILNEYNMSDVGEELVYMRGENIESFKADSGKVLSHIYTEPIFYQTDADTMARIDTSIKPIDELEREILYSAGWAAYDSIVDAGPYKFYWDAAGANSCFMRDGKYLLYEMVSERSGVVTTYSPTTSGIKELIKVSNDTLKTITWNVAGNIATIYNYGDGQYDLQDGGFLFRINKPVAWDDSGKAVEINTLYTNGTLSYTWDNSDVVYPVWVDPTVKRYNWLGDSMYATDSDYATAHAQTTADGVYGYLNVVGQSNSPTYLIARGFANFVLPYNFYTVTACSMYIHIDKSQANNSPYFFVYNAAPTRSVYTTADFSKIPGWHIGGLDSNYMASLSYSEISDDAYNAAIFNSAGRDSVKAAKNDTLWVAFATNRDYNGSTPTANEYYLIGGNSPYLSLTYTTVPTVTTQDATNITSSSCTGNGTITLTGDLNCTRRGFCYIIGTSGDPTTSDSVAYDDGSYTSGTYTKAITGLNANTGYRIRAYAINPAGTSYGTTIQVTTSSTLSIPFGPFKPINNGVIAPFINNGSILPDNNGN